MGPRNAERTLSVGTLDFNLVLKFQQKGRITKGNSGMMMTLRYVGPVDGAENRSQYSQSTWTFCQTLQKQQQEGRAKACHSLCGTSECIT